MWEKELGPDLKGVLPKSFFEERGACGDLLRECSHDVIMMGTQKSEAQLFSYTLNLAKQERANHPLRLTTLNSQLLVNVKCLDTTPLYSRRRD
jgi:hypothetical protein